MANKSGFNAFVSAQAEFDRVADLIDLDEGSRHLLRMPQREFHFTIPVRLANGHR